MKKSKLEVIIPCKDKNQYNNYINHEYNKKLVILNAYDKFWGQCEIADLVIKRFIDTGNNAIKMDFISCDNTIFDPELVGKTKIRSKPKYFIIFVI